MVDKKPEYCDGAGCGALVTRRNRYERWDDRTVVSCPECATKWDDMVRLAKESDDHPRDRFRRLERQFKELFPELKRGKAGKPIQPKKVEAKPINIPREKEIHERSIEKLNKIPGCYAEKNHGGPYGHQKLDITGAINGIMFQLETKKPGEEPTEQQYKTMARWKDRTGCIVGWHTTPEQAVQIVMEGYERIVDRIRGVGNG